MEGVEGTQMKTGQRNGDGQKKVVIIGQEAQKMNLEPSSTLFILSALQKKPLKMFQGTRGNRIQHYSRSQ